MAAGDLRGGATKDRLTPVSTIFALASGRPPCAIAVVRISGPDAFSALHALTRRELPRPRMLVVRDLVDEAGDLLDRAMVVRFTSPASATGEDVVELHLHGSVAVVAAVVAALAAQGLTPAGPGAFTRRAFDHGKVHLGEVEALGDLIAAETEGQRRAALVRSGLGIERLVEEWRTTLLAVRADVEATLDFAEDEGVPARLSADRRRALAEVADALSAAIADGRRGTLIRDGVTVAIVGPVNAGKSTLLNALARRDAALVSDIAGTTRDVIEVRLVLAGQLVVILDTAGIRDTADPLEAAGIARGMARAAAADLVVDLGPSPAAGTVAVAAQADRDGRSAGWRDGVLHLSALTGAGMDALEAHLAQQVAHLVRPGETALITNARQLAAMIDASIVIRSAVTASDIVLIAEHLRRASHRLMELIGRVADDDVLDAVFSRFCIGK